MQLQASISVESLNLDSWSNNYVGAHWLAYDELPEKHWQAATRHGPLSQLVLIASQNLVEQMFFTCIDTILQASPGKFATIEKAMGRPHVSFGVAFERWPAQLGLAPFDMKHEPYASLDRLRVRRNATVHRTTALASLEMARSALFSAVEGSHQIALDMVGPSGWSYDDVLAKYPLRPAPWFSTVAFIERPRKKP